MNDHVAEGNLFPNMANKTSKDIRDLKAKTADSVNALMREVLDRLQHDIDLALTRSPRPKPAGPSVKKLKQVVLQLNGDLEDLRKF